VFAIVRVFYLCGIHEDHLLKQDQFFLIQLKLCQYHRIFIQRKERSMYKKIHVILRAGRFVCGGSKYIEKG